MNYFLKAVILTISISVYATDFIDTMVDAVLNQKSWKPVISQLEEKVESTQRKVRAIEKKIRECKTEGLKKELNFDLKNAQAEHEKARIRASELKKKCNDKRIKKELEETLREIDTLNNRYQKIVEKIKSAGTQKEQIALAHAQEINSILTKIAGQKSKITDLLGLV